MSKQTAVEWLVDKLEKHHTDYDIKNTVAFNQAKEMERQQIIDAWIDGEGYDCIAAKPQAEQYYTQTFTEPKND